MKYIRIFQAQNGLVPDGIIGKKTLRKIQEVYSIPTDASLANFVANAHHESGGFQVAVENLNYSAAGLLATFPNYFPTMLKAKEYARRDEAIANVVYASRMANGRNKAAMGLNSAGVVYCRLPAETIIACWGIF
ncbi:peptidoglycan-binding domain-containing protein [Flavobacterium sp. 3HN19-14]|uniref:peptidoglycan-binding domain-containing protein n=1 Tax=Flavobacterium sp. 3HN19-14 TaxID=3448133 RepID=UPI003EE3786B